MNLSFCESGLICIFKLWFCQNEDLLLQYIYQLPKVEEKKQQQERTLYEQLLGKGEHFPAEQVAHIFSTFPLLS